MNASDEFKTPRRSVYLTNMIAGQMGLDVSESLYYIVALLGMDEASADMNQ